MTSLRTDHFLIAFAVALGGYSFYKGASGFVRGTVWITSKSGTTTIFTDSEAKVVSLLLVMISVCCLAWAMRRYRDM